MDFEFKTWAVPASAFDPVIEVKELRLENWLQSYIVFNDGVGKTTKECVRPFQVDLKTIEILSDSQGRLLATMEPISLTAELLLAKCGFHKNEEKYILQPEWENIEYRALEFPENNWIISRGFMNYNHELRSIKYLHELQNILWEVGRIELQIKF